MRSAAGPPPGAELLSVAARSRAVTVHPPTQGSIVYSQFHEHSRPIRDPRPAAAALPSAPAGGSRPGRLRGGAASRWRPPPAGWTVSAHGASWPSAVVASRPAGSRAGGHDSLPCTSPSSNSSSRSRRSTARPSARSSAPRGRRRATRAWPRRPCRRRRRRAAHYHRAGRGAVLLHRRPRDGCASATTSAT